MSSHKTECVSLFTISITIIIILGSLGTAYYFLIRPNQCTGYCLKCKNDGVWNEKDKTCTCKSGWSGIDCGSRSGGGDCGHGSKKSDGSCDCDSCWGGDKCDKKTGTCVDNSDCGDGEECTDCDCVPSTTTCGFPSDVEYPTGANCGTTGTNAGKNDGQMIQSYCSLFGQGSGEGWFTQPGDDVSVFGVKSPSDFSKICTSPRFSSCSDSVKAKGLQSVFKEYSQQNNC